MAYIGQSPASAVVTSAQIADNVITTSKLVFGAVTSPKLQLVIDNATPGSFFPILTSTIQGDDVIRVASTKFGFNPATGTLTLPNIVITSAFTVTGTGAIKLPSGNTLQQPSSPVEGMMRYNTELTRPEVYNGTRWATVGGIPAGRIYFMANS